MAEHRVERDEDLEFAKLIDTKAQPLFRLRSISSANGSYGANSGPTVLLWWFLLPNVT